MEKNDPITTDHAGRMPETGHGDSTASSDLPEPGATVIQRGPFSAPTELGSPDTERADPWPGRHRLLQLDDCGRAQAGRYTFDLHPNLGVMIDRVDPPDDE